MATHHSSTSKKKSSHHGQHAARDGHTGMSFETEQHFVNVRNKIAHYVDEQEAFEYEADLVSRPRSRSHRLRDFFDEIFVDGKPVSKSQIKSSTPMASRKDLARHDFKTPQPVRREKKQPSKSHAK
ncbi:unnamed protein product [Adineta ricciae]|uniref:Uncharacterized protein n=1 Tax=Adineta ricciae TaxID=249248 RepID=A0A814FGS3_ADIRI|nr:unnamed protein product [Adineta ricciae]